MTTKIYKYEIALSSYDQILQLPIDFKILSFQAQNDRLYIWCQIDPYKQTAFYTFKLYATGDEVNLPYTLYMGTVILTDFTVWHLYAEPTNVYA